MFLKTAGDRKFSLPVTLKLANCCHITPFVVLICRKQQFSVLFCVPSAGRAKLNVIVPVSAHSGSWRVRGINAFPKMMKYLLNDVAESSDRPTVLSGIWPSGPPGSPLEQSELVKMNCLNQSTYLTAVVSGVNDLPLLCVCVRVCVSRSCLWPECSFFFFFTALLGLHSDFHIEQEGELLQI